jgi:LPXTG-motif cell wall-anchored protein
MGALRHGVRSLVALVGALALGCGVLVAVAPAAKAAVTPVLYSDAYTLEQNEHISIPAPGILANDFGVTSDYRVMVVQEEIWDGAQLDVNGDGSFDFDPNQSGAGQNFFLYCLRLAGGSGCVTDVSVVNLYIDEPFVQAQSYTVVQGSSLSVPSPGLLLGSQNPAPGDGLYVLSTPPNGLLSANSDGSFSYTPNPGFTGMDAFEFCLSNPAVEPLCSGNRSTATITVYPLVQNQAISLLANHSYDGRLYPIPGGGITYAGLITSPAGHGSVDINNDGSFRYTPVPGYTGADAFHFCLSQNNTTCIPSSPTATVSVTVNPESVDTSTTVTGPASVSFGAGATVVATVTPNPGAGTVRFAEAGTTVTGCGAVAVAANGKASCTLPGTEPVGPHTITAQFGGVGVYQPSAGSVSVTVTKAPVSVTYTGPATGMIGTLVTVSATVVSTVTSGPVTGGAVSFVMDGDSCTGTTNPAGTAACSLTPSIAGGRNVTVAFAGTASFQSSGTSAAVQVAKRPSTTTVDAGPADLLWSDPVVLTAHVTAGATGTVAFASGAPIAGCGAVQVFSGVAACTTSALGVGTDTVTASYSGDAIFEASSGTTTVTVHQRPVTVDAGDTVTGTVGQPMTVSATVSDAVTGAPLTGLSLHFAVPTSQCDAVSGVDGTASCALFPATAGIQPIDITVTATDHYLAASGTGSADVAPSPTSVTVTAPETGVFSVPVTITATVQPTDGAGAVGFALGGEPIAGCESVGLTRIDATWQAACTTADLPVGTDTVTATFFGTADYLGSDGTATVEVGPAPTAVLYTGDTAGTVAAPLTVSAALTNIAGAEPTVLPDQQLVFTLADLTCTATTDATGSASCTLIPTGVAQAGTLTVQYAATTDYQASGDTAEVAIAASPTETTVQAPETSLFTEAVTIIATVAPSDGAGTVTFSVLDEPIEGCADVPLTETDSGRQAECLTTALAVGDDTVTASFSGTDDYLASQASALVHVDPAPTSLTYTGPADATVGQPIELTAALRDEVDGSPIPGAAVQISWGEYGCDTTTGDDGTASCTVIPDAVADSGPVTLAFAGTDDFLPATGGADIVVAPAPTSTIVAAASTGAFPAPVTITAVVAPSDGAGTVAFIADGSPLAGCDAVPLTLGDAGWQAGCVAADLGAGEHRFDAAFSGSADYVASAGTGTATIGKAPTELGYFGQTTGTVGAALNVVARLDVPADPGAADPGDQGATGQGATDQGASVSAVAFAALAEPDARAGVDALAVAAPRTVDRAGLTVTFTLGADSCQAVTDADGVARCRITPSESGAERTLQLSFDGTANLQAARMAVTVAVAAAPVTSTSSASPSGTTPAPVTSTVQGGSGALPDTGFPTGLVIWVAALLLAAGGLLVLAGRRRRDH